MARMLNEVERRVLGALIEKALAQPQYYPMTVNALVASCNQKSNRDPVMDLDEDAVWSTLEVLRAGDLVSRLLPGGASRVERYKHELKERLGWEKPQRAVMAELLLRGPQTVGELRGRCARMYPFENAEAVQAVLQSLNERPEPEVVPLPRAPGQSAVRYAHTFYDAQEWARLSGSTEAAPSPAPAAATTPVDAAPTRASTGPSPSLADLQAQVVALDARLTELSQRVELLEELRD